MSKQWGPVLGAHTLPVEPAEPAKTQCRDNCASTYVARREVREGRGPVEIMQQQGSATVDNNRHHMQFCECSRLKLYSEQLLKRLHSRLFT